MKETKLFNKYELKHHLDTYTKDELEELKRHVEDYLDNNKYRSEQDARHVFYTIDQFIANNPMYHGGGRMIELEYNAHVTADHCEVCGIQDMHVKLVIDPYEDEINHKIIYVYMCDQCYKNSADDI